MARWWLAAALCAACMCGCAQVHPIDPTAVGSGVVAGLVDESRAHKTILKFRDGASWVSADLRLVDGVLEWREAEHHGGTMRAPVSELMSMTFVRRGRGAWEGSLIGLLTGALVGGIAGAATYDRPTEPTLWPGSPKLAFWGGSIIGGALGSAVGLVVGIVVGSTDVYDFTVVPEETPAPSRRR